MASVEEYLKANVPRIVSSNAKRILKNDDENENYIPSFQGYLDLGFSIHVPCDHTTLLDCRLQIDDFSQSRLESLVMLFLCSEGVELVVSTAPNTLVHVCPFNKKQEQAKAAATAKAASNSAMLDTLAEQVTAGPEGMMVWNLPRFEAETIAFDDPSKTQKTILDMATNTTFILSNGPPQQYYTKLRFTYPVYQWGSVDPDLAEETLQEEFETSVVSTGTLDSLLPWPDAVAAPTGQEPYIFWDASLPAAPGYFDNTISVETAILLRRLGIGMVVANTIGVLVLTILCANHKRKKKEGNKFPDEGERSNQHWRNDGGRKESDYLDTEAGVSAILMESKHYALAKSQAFDVQQRASYNNNNTSSGTNPTGSVDRNITGVEVDLKMVDHPSQLLRTTSTVSNDSNNIMQLQTAPSQLRAPPALGRKEDLLLARAKMGTPWYSDKKLLDDSPGSGRRTVGGEYDDDEDQAEDEDLQILDLVSPKSEISSKMSSRNYDQEGSC